MWRRSKIPFSFLAHLFNFFLWSSDLLAHWPMAAKSNINLSHVSRTCNFLIRDWQVWEPHPVHWPPLRSTDLNGTSPVPWTSDPQWPLKLPGTQLCPAQPHSRKCRSTRSHLHIQTGERKVLHTCSTAPFSWNGSGKVLVSPPRCRLF